MPTYPRTNATPLSRSHQPAIEPPATRTCWPRVPIDRRSDAVAFTGEPKVSVLVAVIAPVELKW